MADQLYLKFINFFKNHNLYDEQTFKYIRENAILFDYLEEEKRSFIGCYYNFDKRGCLIKIVIGVPIIKDEQTLLINIHEYIHAISLYSKLGTKCKIGIEREILPLLYEKIYLNENPNEELERYVNMLNQKIIESNQIEYKIALNLQNELLEYYYKIRNFNKLESKAKKLSKKYNK